jgi:hypothetical protein
VDEKQADLAGGKPARPRRAVRTRRTLYVLLVLVAVLGAARLAAPSFVRSYAIRVLDQNPVYAGEIGDVRLHLWRGAYEIDDVRISKTTGLVPVPFFATKRLQFELEWPALWAGEVVGRVVMDHPELNFVDAEDPSRAQTGAGGPWLEMLRDLSPFRINSTQVRDGEVHFRAFHTDPPVDVYLTKVEGTIDNLTNVHEDVTPMVSTVHGTALAMEHAKVEFEMRLDPFSYRPTFHLAGRMLGLDVTKVNSLALAYGSFDFERGWFDLVVEMDSKEGALQGYVKPLFRDLAVLDVKKDLQGAAVLSLFWEALVGLGKDVLKNQGRNQVATVIPMYGDIDAPKQDVLALIGNVLRNAFVRAYLPTLEGGAAERAGISFGPGSNLGPEGIEK